MVENRYGNIQVLFKAKFIQISAQGIKIRIQVLKKYVQTLSKSRGEFFSETVWNNKWSLCPIARSDSASLLNAVGEVIQR